MHSSHTLSIDLSLLAKSRMGKCDTQKLCSSSPYFEFSLCQIKGVAKGRLHLLEDFGFA